MGYNACVTAEWNLIGEARRAAYVSQTELARRAGTSRPTLSAYESGTKVPRLDTAVRIVRAAGQELVIRPHVEWSTVAPRGRPISVPDRLPDLSPDEALAAVQLPMHLNWSDPDRVFRMSVRRERARVYEIVLREGEPADVEQYVDGGLLVDLWDELVLPKEVRNAWAPLVERYRLAAT